MIYRSFVLAGQDAKGSLDALISRISASLAEGRARLGARYQYLGLKDTAHLWREAPRPSSELRLERGNKFGQRYLSIGAKTEAACGPLATTLGETFSFRTVAELAAQARKLAEKEPALLELMAIAANAKADPEVIDVIEKKLASPSHACRESAVLAAGVLGRPELLPALRTRLATEGRPGLRTMLHFLLEQIEAEAAKSASRRSRGRGTS